LAAAGHNATAAALISAPVCFNAVGAHTGLGINKVFFVVYGLVIVAKVSKLAIYGPLVGKNRGSMEYEFLNYQN